MIYWKAFCLAGLAAFTYNAASAQPSAQSKLAQSKSAPALASLPYISQQDIASTLDSLNLIKQGDASAQRLDWKEAQQEYQQALDLWPRSNTALYGLARCSQAMGDTAKAIAYYRKAVYSDNPADKGYGETNTSRLMEFALLLNKAGQKEEAVAVYNHAAYALDYRDSEANGGKPHLKVLLPEIAAEPTSPEQVGYTPERLEALADTVLAHEKLFDEEGKADSKKAAALYPDSAVVQYYRGETLNGPIHAAEAKVAYQKAAELGDDATVAAAKERLRTLR